MCETFETSTKVSPENATVELKEAKIFLTYLVELDFALLCHQF